MSAVPLVVAATLAALGWPGVQRHRRTLGLGATLVAAACLALAVLVPVAVAALLAGLSWPLALAVAALATAGVSAALGEPGGAATVTAPRAEPRLLRSASLAVLIAAAAAFAVKVARAPLWSWDHYAIWGVKARRLVGEPGFDLAFLSWPELEHSRPGHPLGLPLSWLVLTLGRAPDPVDFKALHVLMGLALLLLVRGAARRATGSWAWGNLAAAMLALSPLYWDTEAVGLAELPLALWAACGAGILLAAPGSRRTAVAGGVLLGFLPWVKTEGSTLGLFLLVGLLWALRGPAADRRRVAAAAVAGFATLGLGARALGRLVPPERWSFTSGDWSGRIVERLPQSGEIALFCLRELLTWDWLLFWPILAIGWLVAIFRGARPAVALGAAVLLQLLLYGATALVTYLPPTPHLEAAFFRIAAALVPLGLLALASLVAEHGRRGAIPPAPSSSPKRRPPAISLPDQRGVATFTQPGAVAVVCRRIRLSWPAPCWTWRRL